MSDIDQVLYPGERVEVVGALHWWIFVDAVVMGLICFIVALAFLVPSMGVIGAALALLVFLMFILDARLNVIGTALTITDRRVIFTFGFIRRHTMELDHAKVEGFTVEQGIIGRMMNFGQVTVTGVGGMSMAIPLVRDPLQFRARTMQCFAKTDATSSMGSAAQVGRTG
jgi:uncharacterized membrane protein YdbT with pleckstrin-like domain